MKRSSTWATAVDLLPLARRPKAIDMTDMEALVISYDMESEEFKRIAAKSTESDSHCQYGPSFLVYERSTGRFLEFFCGNKSSRIEAKKIFPFLPLTQADIDAKAAAGNPVGDLKPHGPIPVTLKVEGGREPQGHLARPGRGDVLHAVHPVAFRRSDRAARSASSSRSRTTASRRSRTASRPAPGSPFAPRRTCRKAPAGFLTLWCKQHAGRTGRWSGFKSRQRLLVRLAWRPDRGKLE